MLLTKSQISKASEKELDQAAEAIKAEMTKRASNSRERALKELKAVAAKHSVSLESLLGDNQTKADSTLKAKRSERGAKVRRKVAAKYANPANVSQTWSGRGRKPLWVADALATGQSLEDLAIKV